MAYNDLETSVESGRPVEYYAFSFGATVWRYTSADETHASGGHTWTACAISRDDVRQSGESSSDGLTVTAPSWIGPAQLFIGGAPSTPVQLTIFARHEGLTDMVVIYMGEVIQHNPPRPGTSTLMCETLSASFRREGLRLGWQRSCPYGLYDSTTCKVNKAAWEHSFRVLSANDRSLQIQETGTPIGSRDLSGGFIEWSHPLRGVEMAPIESHVGTALVLFYPPSELFVGAVGKAYPGCDFTPAKCQAFGNYDNYGGCPDMPGKSPFDGNPVF